VVGKGWEELAVVCKYKGRCESGEAQMKTGVMRRGYMRGASRGFGKGGRPSQRLIRTHDAYLGDRGV
jgi:hypothetical protein